MSTTATVTAEARDRRRLLPEMEGRSARWYARTRGNPAQLAQFRRQAAEFIAGLPDGAAVLEVAPGPGYLAVEMARSGRVKVTGIDISKTMVEIARETATDAGVDVDFIEGDATHMPFASGTFDLIVCQAAFKNFRHPVEALNEMRRVLRPGGTAVIEDLRRDSSRADINREVDAQGLRGPSRLMTRWILAFLRRRAMSAPEFEALARQSSFESCAATPDGISLVVRLG